MTAPVRIQLSRKKGWRIPPETVIVSRPSIVGNPWEPGELAFFHWPKGFKRGSWVSMPICDGLRPEVAVDLFREWLETGQYPLPDNLTEQGVHECELDMIGRRVEMRGTMPVALRGRNLACWCKPGDPCHADVLLDLANRPLAVVR